MFFLLIACGGTSTQYSGYSNIHKYMPLDGNRSWRYENDGSSFDLSIEKTNAELFDGTEIVTISYAKYEPVESLASIDWSSDSLNGILIHGYTITNEGGMEFEIPIVFAQTRMLPGESNETTTDGITFTSTFVALEQCPNNWVDENNIWDCLKFEVSSDGSSTNFPFIGEWWLANTWGPSRFITPDGSFGSSNTWILSQATYSPEE
jgi:hypothetical protein